MSRQNKVNPDYYTLAGRLTPDDLARERRKQKESGRGPGRRRHQKAMPPWMANEVSRNAGGGDSDRAAEPAPQETRAENPSDAAAEVPRPVPPLEPPVRRAKPRGTRRPAKAAPPRSTASKRKAPRASGRTAKPGSRKAATTLTAAKGRRAPKAAARTRKPAGKKGTRKTARARKR